MQKEMGYDILIGIQLTEDWPKPGKRIIVTMKDSTKEVCFIDVEAKLCGKLPHNPEAGYIYPDGTLITTHAVASYLQGDYEEVEVDPLLLEYADEIIGKGKPAPFN